jgi:hypothetical protein
VRSCGCLLRKHGMSNTKEYHAWESMKQRCYNKGYSSYSEYGGRGIKLSKRWLNSFTLFYQDMGPSPKGYELDRKNSDGNYHKSNCRWVPNSVNTNNRRCSVFFTFEGRTQSASQWAHEYGMKAVTVLSRRRQGWSPRKTLKTPVREYNYA